MSRKLVTPILLEKGGKKFILMNFVFETDDSIYITFPSKKERYISKFATKSYDESAYSEHIVKLTDFDTDNVEPKISFHPRDMIIHVNSNITKNFGKDYKLLNVSPDKNKLFVYLLQVIFPNNIAFFDEYNKTKHNDFVVINHISNSDSISLEFIIHSNDIKPTPECLPYSKNRNYCFGYTFDSPYKYTFSIFVSTIKSETNNLLINLNTKEIDCIYTIDNKIK